MNSNEARTAIVGCLGDLAPEIDAATLPPDEALRDALDLDSMDFLRLVQALHARTGVSIPETDYARVRTLRAMADYLAAHAPA